MDKIIVYDASGNIVTQYSSENPKIPKSMSYILIENYSEDETSETFKPIIGVDVTVTPNTLIYGKSEYEKRIDTLSLLEIQYTKQAENKKALSDFLENNPLLWTDGNYYGVTQEDQDEMIADKTTYEFKKSIGDESWKLQWHPIHSECRDFTEEEFAGLLNTIVNFVYPYRQLEMSYKKKIYQSKDKEEILSMKFEYLPTYLTKTSSED
jgi:hypothetical protein